MDDIPIILFSSVFHGVLQEFSYCFQDLDRIFDTTRLVAYPHLVKTEIAPSNLQIKLVALKNDEQFVKKFEDKDLLDTWRGAVKHPNLQELARKSFLRVRSRIFKNEIFEEQVPNPIFRQQSGMWTTTHDIQRAT